MSWEKSSDSMVELFDRLLPNHPKVERRIMFGCPMAAANGNLFMGLHENRLLIRVGASDSKVLIDEFGATFFSPIPGRKSSATLVVPASIAAQPAQLRRWYDKALAYALSLPPKRAKKAKASKSKAKAKRAPANAKAAARKPQRSR